MGCVGMYAGLSVVVRPSGHFVEAYLAPTEVFTVIIIALRTMNTVNQTPCITIQWRFKSLHWATTEASKAYLAISSLSLYSSRVTPFGIYFTESLIEGLPYALYQGLHPDTS